MKSTKILSSKESGRRVAESIFADLEAKHILGEDRSSDPEIADSYDKVVRAYNAHAKAAFNGYGPENRAAHPDDMAKTDAKIRKLKSNHEQAAASHRELLKRRGVSESSYYDPEVSRRAMFQSPDSALRRETRTNPRNNACPTCKEPDKLTPKDVKLGYQCNDCANRDEGMSDY